MNSRSQKYLAYIDSRHWKERRAYLEAMRPHKVCQRSGCPHEPKECHHLHYRTLGHEALADVEFLCVAHHELADREREKHERIAAGKRADARYEKGLDTFMKRRVGDDWEDTVTQGTARHLFDAWLAKQKEP